MSLKPGSKPYIVEPIRRTTPAPAPSPTPPKEEPVKKPEKVPA